MSTSNVSVGPQTRGRAQRRPSVTSSVVIAPAAAAEGTSRTRRFRVQSDATPATVEEVLDSEGFPVDLPDLKCQDNSDTDSSDDDDDEEPKSVIVRRTRRSRIRSNTEEEDRCFGSGRTQPDAITTPSEKEHDRAQYDASINAEKVGGCDDNTERIHYAMVDTTERSSRARHPLPSREGLRSSSSGRGRDLHRRAIPLPIYPTALQAPSPSRISRVVGGKRVGYLSPNRPPIRIKVAMKGSIKKKDGVAPAHAAIEKIVDTADVSGGNVTTPRSSRSPSITPKRSSSRSPSITPKRSSSRSRSITPKAALLLPDL